MNDTEVWICVFMKRFFCITVLKVITLTLNKENFLLPKALHTVVPVSFFLVFFPCFFVNAFCLMKPHELICQKCNWWVKSRHHPGYLITSFFFSPASNIDWIRDFFLYVSLGLKRCDCKIIRQFICSVDNLGYSM